MEELRFQNKTLLTLSTHTAPSHSDSPVLSGPLLTLLLVEAGHAVLDVGRSRYQMSAGDIFVLNAVEPAYIRAIVPPHIIYTRLCFDSSFVAASSSKNTFDYRYLEMFYGRQHIATHKIGSQYAESCDLHRLFAEIGRLMLLKTTDYAYLVKIHLLQLLFDILQYYEKDHLLNPDESLYGSSNETIEAVINFIDDNLSQTLTLPMFGEIAHMNPFYFSTFFKKHTSVSPMQYVLRARIHHAICLLRETDKTILDIALLCGFNSTANFNKAFKKITGKTPSDFRLRSQ